VTNYKRNNGPQRGTTKPGVRQWKVNLTG
jgi:hypothetical protein